ncbi:glycosyltransferase family 1 protein [Comamonas sp. Z1]|uniref:glycosyltransferase family 4 protein n=1 Tax=Comamonas sp. Z1 TaxID=2601246 RepID=UPI0021071782|nr:glycosyltransferase family 1 protein [Comamonas sp. Z1]
MSAKLKNDDFVVWMNVTTSANWNRPPVGIVRVEQALCEELGKIFGEDKFKQCIWQDGQFVEWIPLKNSEKSKFEKAADVILPKLASFDVGRSFLMRALRMFEKDSFNNTVNLSIPIDKVRSYGPRSGDVLISVGLDWDGAYSSSFYNLSKKNGVHVLTCCYDLIPVLFPQYCVGDVSNRFKEYFNMLTWGSAGVLCISKQTEADFLNLCHEIGAPKKPTCIIPLGDNVPDGTGVASLDVQEVVAQPFILFVSTIERRKNHEVLYRAYHLLCRAGHAKKLPKLVFVGMPGWGVSDLLKDIELDPLTRNLIVQLNHVSDADLNTLYKSAYFCLYPSFYEGWGLPVGEALAFGKALLVSDQGSLPEVGGDLVQYISPWSPEAWAEAIIDFVDHPEKIKIIEERVRNNYKIRKWSDTAKSVFDFTQNVLSMASKGAIELFPGYDLSTQAGIHVGANLQSTGEGGYLMFGPHRSLRPGTYMVEIFDNREMRSGGQITIDMVANQGSSVFWSGGISVNPGDSAEDAPLVTFEVNIDEYVNDYEIRCIVDNSIVSLKKINIIPI